MSPRHLSWVPRLGLHFGRRAEGLLAVDVVGGLRATAESDPGSGLPAQLPGFGVREVEDVRVEAARGLIGQGADNAVLGLVAPARSRRLSGGWPHWPHPNGQGGGH